jgi:4-hydroxy-tetrahydrodipicolinate reductase
MLRCLERGVPVVCGTTGWYDRYDEVAAACRRSSGKMLTATNFSLGMNIMFALNERLATLMQGRGYSVSISETHHVHKLDAPSGTAITLQEQIAECGRREKEDIPITSHRVGEVPGIHTVVYDSPIDTLTLTHEAHSRAGLAQGAVLAAEWLAQARPGVYTMKDVLA